MNIDLTLQFNDQWYEQLMQKLVEFVDEWSKTIEDTADANIRYYPQLRGAIKHEVAKEVTEIVGTVLPDGPDAWMSWLEEFGKGSEMASGAENPFLADYQSSEYWNPDRQGNAVTGWGDSHVGLNGELYTPKGHLKGVNLEQLQENSQRFAEWADRHGIDFKPTPPNYFMRDAIDSWRNNIVEDLNSLFMEHLGKLFM